MKPETKVYTKQVLKALSNRQKGNCSDGIPTRKCIIIVLQTYWIAAGMLSS